MAMEKVGIVRKAIRKLFSLEPFRINIQHNLEPLDVLMTTYGERMVVLWRNEGHELTVVMMPRFSTIVWEQIWMAMIIYLLKYKLI